MIGKMPRSEIAERMGVSLASLKRAFRGRRLAFYNYCQANPGLVKSVAKFYETQTQEETANHFGLKRKQVDHIVYRYKQFRKLKQIRWTDQEIIEAAKMAGLVSPHAQAKYFNRPNAHAGSIKSLWMKRFGMGACSVNGMNHSIARQLVQGNKARYLEPYGESRKGRKVKFRRVMLWVDMEKVMHAFVPEFIRSAVHTMADFQRWLWQSKNPKPLIMRMIKEREV